MCPLNFPKCSTEITSNSKLAIKILLTCGSWQRPTCPWNPDQSSYTLVGEPGICAIYCSNLSDLKPGYLMRVGVWNRSEHSMPPKKGQHLWISSKACSRKPHSTVHTGAYTSTQDYTVISVVEVRTSKSVQI